MARRGRGGATAGTSRAIGLLGNFGIGNLGNEASLEAMRRLLAAERPGDRLVVICREPEVAAREHGLPTLPLYWSGFRTRPAQAANRLLLRLPGKLMDFALTLRRVGRFEAVIVPGTGIFCDFMDVPNGMPYRLAKWSVAARIRGVPVAFVSAGADPVGNPASRRLLVLAARLASYRSWRDRLSRDYMAGVGVDVARDPVVPDIAFGLPRRPRPAPAGPVRVGVGVMEYRGWRGVGPEADAIHEDYVASMQRIVVELLDRGRSVSLLIGGTSDIGTVEDLRAAVEAERPGLEPGRLAAHPAATLHELMDQIGETAVVVATRFHNVVAALMAERPVVSFGYSRKNAALMEDFGLGDACQEVDDLDEARLLDQVDRVLADAGAHREHIRRRLERYDEALRAQDRAVLALLGPAPARDGA